ncbi:hypothetical protein LZC95_37120 [Pendulispora brunnea]|uniref:Uncharacterized protein n=1 Tax=Pendulispora brunnea TaxID=2905690 RepID=A0ABZ2K4B7_9BACT
MNHKATAGLLIGMAVVAGCSVMTSFDGYTASDVSCDPLRWPSRPNDGSGGTRTLFGATRQILLADPDAGTDPGLDLDGLCTCPQAGSCVPPTGAKAGCDNGSRGVDNNGGALFGALFSNVQGLQQEIVHGQHGIVVRVDRYNGQANDPDVIASIYNVVGVDGKTDGGASAKFDGTDSFIVDSDSVISDGELQSKYFDEQAYVANNVLVATIPSFRLRLMIPPSDRSNAEEVIEEIKGVQLVGRIEPEGAGLRIQRAVLAGRIPLATMFLHAGSGSVCSDAGVFDFIKPRVCGALDLPADPQANRGTTCNALSFALLLDVAPAQAPSGAKTITSTGPSCPPTDVRCDDSP